MTLYSDPALTDADTRIRALERQVRQLQTALGLRHSSIDESGLRFHSGGSATFEDGGGIEIGEGGEITVNGGALRLTSADGTTGLFYAGTAPDGSRIWQGSFEDGSPAFGLFGGFWAGKDHAGNTIFGDDAISGVGLARPYLNIPMYPSSGTSVGTGGPFWPEFTNTSYQEVWHGFTSLWHPRIAISVNTNTSSGTVEWEVRFDGTTAGSGSGPGSGQFDVPGWGSTYTPGSDADVQLWCRNTAGVASRVVVDGCVGFQS